MAPNIVITGFMGTGKSSVGRLVAERLGRRFVDMDLLIEEQEGRSISDIFAEEGEPYFRALERDLCRELASRQDLVIATGGGTLVDPVNREVMARSGELFCLRCAPEEILRRLEVAEGRPLLDVEARRERIEALLAKRREAYAKIPYQIETTGKTIEQVVEETIRVVEDMRKISVRYPTGRYDIHLGRGTLGRIGGLLRAWGQPSHVAVVSNFTVWPIHGSMTESSLHEAGFNPLICLVPDGEEYKRLNTVRQLYNQFIGGKLDRGSVVIALGGGVVGDMAGFAAATYMRGVQMVQVPTTLLAMVDASVGGKVAVDHPRGKNLIGAFKQPAFVAVDPAVLGTLPDEEMRSGWAEIIKHGIIGDSPLFERLEAHSELRPPSDTLTEIIAAAIRVKVEVVEEDPYERGRRRVLNLGHTFAHAFEVLSDYQLRHGYAVAIGMVVAARVAERMGLCQPELPGRIEALLRAFGLPTRVPDFEPEAIWQGMAMDKKRRGSRLRFVLPRALGDVIVTEEVAQGTVLAVLDELSS
ncbi:MAG: 3-dehydroquinate synthase [Chloroflexota bacterium]|nr:3-dehydroquinate synthase [Chloroflexota bacterium]